MGQFYIKQVKAAGNGKTDSIIDLAPGLNIIKGRSNTGKTCIIKCIDYCFGSKKKPFDESFGYDTISIQISSTHGDIEITRAFGKNQVQVKTTIAGYDNGTYDLNYNPKKKEKLPILSDLLLTAIGIDSEHQIIKNKYYERRRLTWRTFLSLMLFHVSDIAKEESIIEPDQATEKTAFLSALLFLLSGNDFSNVDAQSERTLRKAKKNAVEEYVNKKISAAADKRKELETHLSAFAGMDVEKLMQETLESLQAAEKEIADAVSQSQDLFRQIVDLQGKSAECDLLQSRYSALRTQYVSDIKRLSFIVKGEVSLKKVAHNKICPFCDGAIPERNQQSYIESAQAELNRITTQMEGLSQTEQDVTAEQLAIKEQLTALSAKRDEIEALIAQELRPQAEKFEEALRSYRTYIQIKQEFEVIGTIASSYETDLRNLPSDDESNPEFHPKDYFGKEFQEGLDKLLKDALTECCYDNLTSARFNKQDFDIEVNGHKKSSTHGQGYCSYLNSIIAFAFRQYLFANATYDPGFLVIDTPLLGLDQGLSDMDPESMRTALFTFFTNHQNEGQVIILENIKHIPEMDFESTGANVITFTKGLAEGRYGFLVDVK